MKATPAVLAFCAALALVVLAGCGSSNYGAPDGSTITINPTSITFADARTTDEVNSQPIIVTVRNKDGIPIPGVNIFISVPTTFIDEVAFRDSLGAPVSGTQFSATTDSNGIYSFIFQYNSGNGRDYFGDVAVSSNSAYITMTFTITP